MADQTIPMDDKELFSSAMAPEPTQETPAPVEATTEGEQPRDEQGRFAPKAQDADAAPIQQKPVEQTTATTAPATEAKTEPDGQVPSWRLREVNEQRTAAEKRADEVNRQFYQLQAQFNAQQQELTQLRKPKQEPVDFFQNPDEAFQQRLSPFEERFAQLQNKVLLNASRAVAVATHGAPAVSEMEQAIEQAMQQGHPEMRNLAAQMRSSDDPVGLAMQWHQREKLVKETGGDITGYKTRLADDLLKDPAFLAKALEAARAQAGQPSARPAIELPPSLNKAPGAGGSNASAADDNDMSDRALFRHAMAPGRR